jgi:ribosomal protein S18 acetylase RimI-like enzyme
MRVATTQERFWCSLLEPADPALADEWPGRTFLLFDLAVRSSSRGQGIGHRLHDGLLSSRREERAMLTVQATAVETQAIYQGWHWSHVGQLKGGPTGVFEVFLRAAIADLKED